MKFCKKMLFVCTNKLCISQCMKLIRLTEMEKYTLPKAILEGFLSMTGMSSVCGESPRGA